MTLNRARCAVALISALTMTALSADSDAPATTLEADDFTLDLESGVRTYRGAVAFRHGAFALDCDELATHHDADGAIEKGICRGAPGRFAQRDDDERDAVRGRARTIEFDNRAGIVVLQHDAQIEHGGNRIEGARITYHIASRRIEVGSDGDQRARMTVQPRAQDEQ